MFRILVFIVVLFAALISAPELVAQLPRTISFQGVLTDASGNPLPDGQRQLRIALYSTQSGGSALYSEQHNATTQGGVFSLLIGSVTPIPSSLEFDRPYFIGVSVNGGAELSPRTPLTSVPYALHAQRADHAATAAMLLPGADGVVTSVNGLDGDITLQGAGGTSVTKSGSTITITSAGGSASGIAGVQNSDGTLDISNPSGPIATLGVADNAIGSAKLKVEAVTESRIASNAVTTSKIADAAIRNEKIADAAVTSPKLADEAVTAGKLADGAVLSSKLAAQAVLSSNIAAGAVTLDKISGAGASVGQVPTFTGSAVQWMSIPAASGGGGLELPFTDTINISKPAVFVENLGGDGLTARAVAGRNAIRGIVSSGVGSSFYLDAGVAGFSTDGRGIGGTSQNGSGVEGSSSMGSAGKFSITNNANSSPAVLATSSATGPAVLAQQTASNGTAAGVEGITYSTNAGASGVYGNALASGGQGTYGVHGRNSTVGETGAGVYGHHVAGGKGVQGFAQSGTGVHGESSSGVGVRGVSATNAGVEGSSSSGPGVLGHANSVAPGVEGNSSTFSPAVLGKSTQAEGVRGESNSFIGVRGVSSTKTGVEGSSVSGDGVMGYSQSGSGVYGKALSGVGVRGEASASGVGVLAESGNAQSALRAENSNSGSAVTAVAESGMAVSAFSSSGVGVRAYSGSANIVEAYGSGGFAGNLRFRVLQDGNVRCDGAFTGGGADVAEAFDFEGERSEYEAGDVLVISDRSDRKVMKSTSPNSTAVAGVYATKPGVLLAPYGAEEDIDHLLPMGVVGVIPTKVCAEQGPIRRGDLLVTSSTPGHAMKAVAVVVNGVTLYPSGAIIGKALQNFDGPGSGTIEVLVNVK